jgi:hypothetical protein
MKEPTATATTNEPRLWWLLVSRAVDLELRRRKTAGRWRFVCPVDASHEVTLSNGKPGLALCCQGPAGQDTPGHSLAIHSRHRNDSQHCDWSRPDLAEIPYPCRFCGCTESQVLAALGARPRDKFPQPGEARACSVRGCRGAGYALPGKPSVLCLSHLSDRAGLDRVVLFGEGPR